MLYHFIDQLNCSSDTVPSSQLLAHKGWPFRVLCSFVVEAENNIFYGWYYDSVVDGQQPLEVSQNFVVVWVLAQNGNSIQIRLQLVICIANALYVSVEHGKAFKNYCINNILYHEGAVCQLAKKRPEKRVLLKISFKMGLIFFCCIYCTVSLTIESYYRPTFVSDVAYCQDKFWTPGNLDTTTKKLRYLKH